MRAIDADRLLKMMSHWKPYMDMDKVRKAVQNMPTLTPPNAWVKVDENLPDFDVPVLVYVKDIFDNKSIINITKYTITYDLTNNWLGYENSSFKITHWMPLPEPPTIETQV